MFDKHTILQYVLYMKFKTESPQMIPAYFQYDLMDFMLCLFEFRTFYRALISFIACMECNKWMNGTRNICKCLDSYHMTLKMVRIFFVG